MLRWRLFASPPLHILDIRLAHFSFKAALSSLFHVLWELSTYYIINFQDEFINNRQKRSAYTPIACTKVTLCPNFRSCKALRFTSLFATSSDTTGAWHFRYFLTFHLFRSEILKKILVFWIDKILKIYPLIEEADEFVETCHVDFQLVFDWQVKVISVLLQLLVAYILIRGRPYIT